MNHRLLKDAVAQTLSYNLTFGETHGARAWKAIEKAETEIKENNTIEFANGRLTFISRESGKTRNVTPSGCHESCDCGNQYSYHKAIFQILARYYVDEMFESFGTPTPQEELDRRAEVAELEFRSFCASLPKWVPTDEHFNLYLMTAKERGRWMEANSPYLRPSTDYKPTKLGSVRF